MNRWYVVEAPRDASRRLFEGATLATCLAWLRERSPARGHRLEIHPVETSTDRPDAILCVPTRLPEEWEDVAAGIVDGWEARWLLIQSAPPRHRDEARADLLDALAVGLATAAVNGQTRASREDDTDVGF